MNVITRLMNWLFMPFDWNDDEYCERFVLPKVERARALGIPDAEIDRMWKDAVRDADPLIIGQAPGSRFAALIDLWEANNLDTTEYSK